MIMIWFYFLLFLKTTIAMPQEVLISGCDIFSQNGEKIKKLPGFYCDYFSDGKSIVSNGKTLRLYSPEMATLWEKKLHCHHQITVTADEQSILAICSQVQIRENKKIRSDLAIVFAIDGSIRKQFDMSTAYKYVNYLTPFNWDTDKLDAEVEETHVNSFQEIPPNKSPIPAFQAGNYIVNDCSQYTLILDRSMQNVLWRWSRKNYRYSAHDVQVTPQGNIIFYNNKNYIGNNIEESIRKKHMYTSIDEYDPVKNKIIWKYRANPPESFFSEFAGGQQILPNQNILFSDKTKNAEFREVTRGGKIVKRIHLVDQKHSFGQPIRKRDLASFLEKHQGI